MKKYFKKEKINKERIKKEKIDKQEFYNLRSKKIPKQFILKKNYKEKDKENEKDKELIFINKTIEPNKFIIEDVLGDNACFYRCLSNIIYYNNHNDISFGYYSEEQDNFARDIQNEIVNWLFTNRNKEINDLSLKVKDLVIDTHDMFNSYDLDNISGDDIFEKLMVEYLERYSKFAGDFMENEYDRWAGACEQYAISEILKKPIYIYVSKKYNTKNKKIENGKIRNNKAEKGVRLQLYQVFGEKYDKNDKNDNNYNNGIHILYKNTKNCEGHYMCLYKK